MRIGLSATQRPLDDIAHFLGGQTRDGSPRPVSIVDAGMRKSFDLKVQVPVKDMTVLPQQNEQGPSVWPAIYDRLIELVDDHESTLIFANSRRVVERIASEMNRRFGYERVQAHHGSVSRERRHQIEQELKEGRLPALVATSSMELGIDVGAIDLVCQVEAPFSVASGMQRIGRAGHLVRATSKGRVIPKTRADLLLSAAMARSMLRGEISGVRIPRNPLDVLAQQMIAMVAVDEWNVPDLYRRIRCAYPYRDLPVETFQSVLALISGRFGTAHLPVLRPRVSWDRVNDRLNPLPGTRHLAILNGGVIPDTGQFAMVLEDGKTRLGELDEEFVFERRLGDTFVLGTGQWRVLQITNDRVIVAPCDESEAMMPFWKGEGLGHDWEFGAHFGEFLRRCEQQLDDPALITWLQAECALDEDGAGNLAAFLRKQVEQGGALPTDRRILVDAFRNEAGDERLAVMSTFGRSFHLSLLLLLQHALRQHGIDPPEAVYSNAGLILRLGTLTPATVMTALQSLRSDAIQDAMTHELEKSPYFALRFRRNAGRALLLPRSRPGRRTPLWLQRLRAHDLLKVASEQPSFPIMLETYRELLEDVLPLDGLRDFLAMVAQGNATFLLRRDRQPSPLARALLLDFTTAYLYLEDRPVGRGRPHSEISDDLSSLLGSRVQAEDVLDRDVVTLMEDRLQGTASFHQARNGAEMVEMLRRIGDLTEAELLQRCNPEVAKALPDLLSDGRIIRVPIRGLNDVHRLAAGDEVAMYDQWDDSDVQAMVARYVGNHALMTRQGILNRYPAADGLLEEIRCMESWVDVELADGSTGWSHPQVLASMRRMTMSQRRRSIQPVSAQAYQRFLLARHVATATASVEELSRIMDQLVGCRLTAGVWHDVLSSRIQGFQPEQLDELVREGIVTWSGGLSAGGQRLILFGSPGLHMRDPFRWEDDRLDDVGREIVSYLTAYGASFLHQLTAGLNKTPTAVAPALWDLIWAGWVTNDSLDPAWGDKPLPQRWQGRRRQSVWGKGRWSLVPTGCEDLSEENRRINLRRLMEQMGVVTREILHRADTGMNWRNVYPILTRMEWAGEVDRALFVSGLSGPQFAFREAAQALMCREEQDDIVLLNVNDPANVYGELFPVLRPDGARHIIRHHPSNYLVLENGHPILAVENRGERLIPLSDLTPRQRLASFRALTRLVAGRHRPTSMRALSWDGHPIVNSGIEGELASVGFVRDGAGMILYRTFG